MRKYRLLTGFLAPLLPLWLYWRAYKGKEDAARIRERFGKPSQARPKGPLMWLHAASVGEANSVLPLMERVSRDFPHLHILLTTGTVSSARLMAQRLPKNIVHQYAPVDTPQATRRFMKHWRPDYAFWIESEFWPNLIFTADDYRCFMGVINARISDRSFRAWQKRPQIIAPLLRCFDIIFAQSDEDAARLRLLGAKEITCVGNLKYDAALLSCDEAELLRLKDIIGSRPVWLAASTHPGEEAQVARAHKTLTAAHPNLLTLIAPRHPHRGSDVVAELAKFGQVAQRSKHQSITAQTSFYIADTMGELGLFYRLGEIVFMGGSLVRHGGQNPLEPARLACAIVTGPHTHNFNGIYHDLEKIDGCRRVTGAKSLAAEVGMLLNNSQARGAMQSGAKKWVESQGGATARLLALLTPLFAQGGKK